jgi:preprotein translocase subunit YajC
MLFSLLMLLAEDPPKGPGDGGMPPGGFLIPLVLMFGAMYLILILPAQRKEKKQREMLMNALKKHDEVVTAGGVIGIVQNIKDDEVVLKLEDNAKMRVLRSSIAQIRASKDSPSQNPSGADSASDAIQKLPRG